MEPYGPAGVKRFSSWIGELCVVLTHVHDALGERRQGFPGEEPYDIFRYHVVRVWRLSAGPLLAGGLGTSPLAPISAVTERELPGVIKAMEDRLARRSARSLAGQLWSATYILMGLRYSQALAHQLLQGVLTMKESVTYQAILAEGEAKGKAEGKAEGAMDQLRKMVLLQGSDLFGPPDAQTVAALESIADVQRLEELARRLIKIGSWHELLAESPLRRRPGHRPRGS